MKAIVLSRQDWREFDQLVSLYSKHYGKKEILARGVKKITSKNAAHIEPFSLVRVEIVKGKKIDHLTRVQPLYYYKKIRVDLNKSACALYAVDILNKLTKPNEMGVELYNLTKSFLDYLENNSCSESLVLAYVSRVMLLLGFAPEVDHCAVCRKRLKNKKQWSVERGGVICGKCGENRDKGEANVEEMTSLWQEDWDCLPDKISVATKDFLYDFLQYCAEQEIPRLTLKLNCANL